MEGADGDVTVVLSNQNVILSNMILDNNDRDLYEQRLRSKTSSVL